MDALSPGPAASKLPVPLCFRSERETLRTAQLAGESGTGLRAGRALYGQYVTEPVCVALNVLVAGQPPSTAGSR
jgi:hypothetical protein